MILPFSKIGKNDAGKAGGKGASLGEMTQAGIPVPPGFVVLAEAFETFIDTNNLRVEIQDILRHLDHNSVTSIEGASEKIQELVLNGEIPSEIQKEIKKYQKNLNATFVAVRSSATAEDGIEHAWAGQLDTYLNVSKNDILKKIQSCWASLFTPRALFYRSEKGLADIHISVAVVVQSMVDAESAGVAFSVHPVTENTDEIVIEGSWGLGEAVVSGEVTPDSYVVSKSSKETLSQHIADKKKGIFRNIDGLNEWRQIPEQEREKPVLTKKALNQLSELVIHIENHYGFPCDIEWAYAGGKIYILQARPITTLKVQKIEKNIFQENWQLGATRNMPLWHDILCLSGWEDNMGDYGVDEKCRCLFAIENATHATMFMQPENQKRYFEATARKCSTGEKVKKLRKIYEKYAEKVQESLKQLIQKRTEKNLQIFFNHYQTFTAGLWITTGFGRIGTDQLQEALLQIGVAQKKLPEIISILTYPEEHTPLFLSQSEMVKIGLKGQKNRKIDTKKELEKWLEKYKYIPVNFCEDPWDMKDAKEQLKNILEHDCQILTDDLEKNHKQKIQDRKILRKKYNKKIQDISDALAETTSLNEYRKNIFCRLSYSIRFFFEKMMKKIGSSDWRDAYYCTPEEMLQIMRGEKINISKIKEDRKKCVFVREGDTIVWGKEKEIKNLFEKIYNGDKDIPGTLTGFSANKGKITGTVKVVLSTKDFHKVNRGDILVATMTSVDFVPIMEKAGAFITNEGGITSHAAIVAREMNKPCIIGTKIATKVLHDGDIVEVDADNGTVKKITQYINGSKITKGTKLFAMRDRKQLLSPVYWNGIVQSSPITKGIYGEILSEIFMVFKDGRQKMFFIQDEWSKISHAISDRIINDVGFFKGLVKKEKECREKIQTFLKKEKTKNSQKYREKIKSLFIEYDAITVYAWFVASDSMKEKIFRYLGLTEEESNYVFLPDEPTYVAQMEKELLENTLKKIPNTKKLAEKYYWIPFGYNGPEIWTPYYFKKEIKKMNKREIKAKLENITEGEKRIYSIKKEIHKKHNFNESEKEMIEKMKIITTWTDIRKMLDYQLFHKYYESLKLLGKEKNIKVNILQELFTEELNNLNNKIIERAKKRINGQYTLQYKGGEVYILSPENHEKIIDMTRPQIQENIQGQVACNGEAKKIQGPVRICISAKQASTINTGDILVSSMTTPDYAIGMNKASGFITDEGGVTCHAAIVAREMNKPCIIATKNATQMLKDGDFVEMNLENGVIKILEKENDVQWSFTYDRQMSYQRIDLFHHGYCPRLSDFFDVTLENELYRIQDGIVSVFYDRVGHKQAFDKIRALLVGRKKTQWYKKIYNTITKDYREFIRFLDQGEKKKNISDIQKALTKHMEHNRKISLSTWLLYSYLEEILSDTVKIILEKKGIKDWQRIFEILGQPDEMIPSDKWEYDIAEAVLADNEKQEKIIKELCLKYRSYGMYDVMFNGKSEGDIQEKISSTSKNDAQKTIKNLQEKYSKQKSELKKIGKISWSESESSLIQLYRLYANFKDWKNFHRERSSYQIREMYQEIAKKYKQKQENLSYMTKEEILDGIEQKKWVNEDEIQNRKKNSALIFIGKSIKSIHSTQKLEELDKKLFIEQNAISGTTVFPGNISGTACIINSHDDLRKLKKGDIMVSSTTRPDYLPFIADIAGFVTNEGGALSHAAILAREIKKPCIIGTKIATQVIKSGDEITMDGKNGIITIHQKKRNYFDDKKLLSEGGRACYLYPNRIFSTRMNIPHPLWENHLMVISTSENHKVNWYFAVKDESEFDYTLKRVLKNKDMLQEGEKEINRLMEKAKKTLKKEYKTVKETWAGYQDFINIYEEIAIVPTFVRQLDRAVVRSLRESIHEEDFAVATYASKRTYQRQEEVALLELRNQFEEKITKDIQKELDRIYEQYFTSSLGYFEEHIKTKSDYLEKLLGSSKKEAKNHLKKILEEEKEIMGGKLKLKKLFPEKASVIDIAGFLVYLKDHYKFQINRVQYYAEGLFRSISKISGYHEGLIRDMTPEEVKNLLLFKKINKENIYKRIAYHAYVYNELGEPELIVEEEAKNFSQKYLATNNLQKSFSGRIACKGRGTGKAKVILGIRDFHKMEQGDILVVMNTSPDFVPIMKKAAAIVAEEGGITGHVSVVSREFGIPSVVGIKQITSIIQDGEIIEVDAEKGIVIRHN